MPIHIDVSYTRNTDFDRLRPRPDPSKGGNVAVVYGVQDQNAEDDQKDGYFYGENNLEALGAAVMFLSSLENPTQSLSIKCLD